MNDIRTGQEAAAVTMVCPACGSPAVDSTTTLLSPEISKAQCAVCDWSGTRRELVVHTFRHEMGSDEKLVQAMVDDLRNVLAVDFAKSFGKFLMKWGFISSNVTPLELSQYIVAIAQATMAAILTVRRKIEQERHG